MMYDELDKLKQLVQSFFNRLKTILAESYYFFNLQYEIYQPHCTISYSQFLFV